jgi:four helix bundle protein
MDNKVLNLIIDMNNYKKLDAWQQAMLLIKEIYVLTEKYPKEEIYGLTSQSKRAAVSIAANIAEGIGRNYKKDTIQFLHIARGSAYETETLLEAAVIVGILPEQDLEKPGALIEKCIQLINGLIRYYENAALK